MIKEIVALLMADDWLIGDEDIDIAKGKYAFHTNYKAFRKNRKRWQTK